jgi:CO/xanthine dehydrogenase FAD-binding subunit
MPAEDEEIEDAIKEGVELQFLVAPKKAVVEGDKLAGLECAKMKLGEPDASGRPRPVEIKGSEFTFKADWVISAIGQDQNLLGLDNKAFGEICVTKNNGIQADSETFQTTVPGVFAGGDVVTGPATAVEAIAAGRKAAKAIEDYLSGRAAHTGVNTATQSDVVQEKLRPINSNALRDSERVSVVELSPSKRCFDVEDYVTIDDGKLGTEAHRCLDCSCVAVNASDVAPALVALGASIRTNKRTIEAEDFFTVRIKDTTVLGVDELVKEIHVPPLKAGTKNSFHKFRIRNSIDFPIVSVAASLLVEGSKIKEARMVFGAVAPVPLRAMGVEEYLVGKEANEETAAQAGEIAVRQVYPLSCNKYKAQILKGMIRKAILGQK